MSFYGESKKATVFAPGWFLATEECERKTRQIAQIGAETLDNGNKIVRMGTIYPSNDGNAEGIVYEDIDVTSGDMPGSVVLSGTVYEDRLAFTGYSYTAAIVGNYVSPKEQGWYERSGSSPDYTYTLSTDTTAASAKTYYAKSGNDYNAVTVGNFVNPSEIGWYESDDQSPATYTLSTDTTADDSKTYYIQAAARMSAAAKSALAGKGFKFVATSPTIERPY